MHQQTFGVESFLRNRWRGMHKRCSSKRPEVAKNYAARGIAVSPEWSSFAPFKAYVENHLGLPDFSSGTRWTLDRINNELGYAPGNIRWATYKENIRNRRSTLRVEFRGETVLIVELAELVGMPYELLVERIVRNGWSVERAVSEPAKAQYRRSSAKPSSEVPITYQGRTQSLKAWTLELELDIAKVRRRLRQGWGFERAAFAPPDRSSGARTKQESRAHGGGAGVRFLDVL